MTLMKPILVVYVLPFVVAHHPSRRGEDAAPQDKAGTFGLTPDPHGEEAHRAVSNHEALRMLMVWLFEIEPAFVAQ